MATRTWVSGVGDDANLCSRIAPCKTFAGAISKTATGGEIDALDPGGFGPITITKSITLDGGQGSGFASILAAGTNGIVINAGANDVVTLRNLSINGAGTGVIGIRILAARAVFIEQCEIFGFQSNAGGEAGLGINDVRSAGGSLFVTNSTIRNNSTTGIRVVAVNGATPFTVTIDNCWLQGNGNGGLAILRNSVTTISNSIITGNVNIGISVEQAGTVCNIEHCVIAHNGIGLAANSGTPTVRLSHSTIVNNATGIAFVGNSVASFGNNRIAANGNGNAPSPNATIALV